MPKTQDRKTHNAFTFTHAAFLPFRDQAACDRVRRIARRDICRHSNPELRIEVIPDAEFNFRCINDIFLRIKTAADHDRQLVMILPQPHPLYRQVAWLINRHRVDCRKLYTFNMDEWADEAGRIAPETYPRGFMYAMKHNFYQHLDPVLRPPEDHIQGPNDVNFKDYDRMLADLGGAEVCYGGIGWSSHLAFVEPGAAAFGGPAVSFDEWKEMGTRLVDLSPLTIAQSALDADFGISGDWSHVPPRAATIGPRQMLTAKLRSSWNGFAIDCTRVSWQRFTVRLALHGPVTPQIPASLLQAAPTEAYLSETVAADIETP